MKLSWFGIPILNPDAMLQFLALILVFAGSQNLLCASQDPAHLTIHRRGGAVARHEPANLTRLVQLLNVVERRYSRAKREVKGNKLIRRWKARSTGTTNDEQLLGEPGQDGSW